MVQNLFCNIKKLDPRAVIPTKREEDAGYDLYALFDEDLKILKPGEIWLAPSGISMEFPIGYVFFLAERGSTGSKGLSRRAGVVDSGYRGELKIALNNTSNKTIVFTHSGHNEDEVLKNLQMSRSDVTFYPQGKAVAQGMFLQEFHVEFNEVEELSNSQRGDGALGSSGK